MNTFQNAMQNQAQKVELYLRQAQTEKPVQFHELKALWDVGGDICGGCFSTHYRNCVSCATSGVFTPIYKENE